MILCCYTLFGCSAIWIYATILLQVQLLVNYFRMLLHLFSHHCHCSCASENQGTRQQPFWFLKYEHGGGCGGQMEKERKSIPSNIGDGLWVLDVVVFCHVLYGWSIDCKGKKVSTLLFKYFACFLLRYFSFEYCVLFSNCWLFWLIISIRVCGSVFFFSSSMSSC